MKLISSNLFNSKFPLLITVLEIAIANAGLVVHGQKG